MERIIFISCMLTMCFVFVNCARIHIVDPPLHAPSMAPSTQDSTISIASAPSTDECSDVIFGMADCVPFMTDGSKATRPDGSCCPGLEMVLKASDDCICEAIESSTDLGIPLNMSKALALPAACGISAPNSLSQCGIPLPPGASGPARATPIPSLRSPSPKSQQAPTSSVNLVPAPTPTSSPNSGTYSISASLALILSMLSATFYCVSY